MGTGDPLDEPGGWLDDADDVLEECLDLFSVPASFKAAGEDWEPILSGGIFRETHREIDPVSGASVSSLQPSLDIRRTEIPIDDDLDDEDRVYVRGRVWAITDVQKDGETGARLLLNEVSEDGP